MADKTYKNLFDDGSTTYHEDGTKSKSYKNLFDDGVTTYHEDGTKSKSYRNLLDDGVTTYHEDGTKSKSYRNLFDDGVTTYHEDGSKSRTYKNLLDDGYTTYHERSPYSTSLGQESGIFGSWQQAYTPSSSTVNQGPWQDKGSYTSVTAADLRKLETANLEGERRRQYLYYAAQLLKGRQVKFDGTADRAQYWQLQRTCETSAKGNQEREDESYNILTEYGLCWYGEERSYYGPKSFSGTGIQWRDVTDSCNLGLIDLMLSRNKIEMSSARFAALPEAELGRIMDWTAARKEQQDMERRRLRLSLGDRLTAVAAKQAPFPQMWADGLFLVLWILLGLLGTGAGGISMEFGHIFLLTLGVFGLWLGLRHSECIGFPEVAACFVFSFGMQYCCYGDLSKPSLILFCLFPVIQVLHVNFAKRRNSYYATEGRKCAILYGFLAANALIALIGIGIACQAFTAGFLIASAVTGVQLIIEKFKDPSYDSGFTKEYLHYWNKKCWLFLGCGVGFLLLGRLAEGMGSLRQGIFILCLFLLAGGLLTRRTDITGRAVRSLMLAFSIALFCAVLSSNEMALSSILYGYEALDAQFGISVFRPLTGGVFALIERIGTAVSSTVSYTFPLSAHASL